MKVLVAAAATSLLFLSSVSARPQPAEGPGGRNKPGFVYDSSRKKLVLFGGFGKRGEPTRGDTWEWAGGQWKLVATSGPSIRGAMGMAYDAKRKKTVLFGGNDGASGRFADTWEWDGSSWKQVASTGPSARSVPQMAYDSTRKKVVLFGGIEEAGEKRRPMADVWEWDGKKWTELPSSGPAPRFHHAMAYDPARKRMVVFGGNRMAPPPEFGVLGDTWEWNGSQWSEVAATGAPKRDHHGMAHDAKRGRTVVFGGCCVDRKFFGDTWEWDGQKWTELAPPVAPSPRGGVPSMTYDSHRQKVILFGGWDASGAVDDLWEWDGKSWSRLE